MNDIQKSVYKNITINRKSSSKNFYSQNFYCSGEITSFLEKISSELFKLNVNILKITGRSKAI